MTRLLPSGKFRPFRYQQDAEAPDKNGSRLESVQVGKPASSGAWYLSFLKLLLRDIG
jgi:hypothetical protein